MHILAIAVVFCIKARAQILYVLCASESVQGLLKIAAQVKRKRVGRPAVRSVGCPGVAPA